MTTYATHPRPELPIARRGTRQFVLTWLPALIGVCVIILESTSTFTATNTSRWLRPVWQAVFGVFSDPAWEKIHHYIRKTGHFIGYGTLSLLFLRGWLRTLLRGAKETLDGFRLHAAGLAILCTFMTASADEFHQTFIPGRTGLLRDVVLDTAGGLTAHLLFALIAWVPRHSAFETRN